MARDGERLGVQKRFVERTRVPRVACRDTHHPLANLWAWPFLQPSASSLQSSVFSLRSSPSAFAAPSGVPLPGLQGSDLGGQVDQRRVGKVRVQCGLDDLARVSHDFWSGGEMQVVEHGGQLQLARCQRLERQQRVVDGTEPWSGDQHDRPTLLPHQVNCQQVWC